jgi:cytoplasmic iron level regulating protein YaaA (DUF328/UPF0246 family)
LKIIISPAKKMKRKPYSIETTEPIFYDDATQIAEKMKKYSIPRLKKAFKCSDKIATEVYEKYQSFNDESYPALFLYEGLQYMNIDVKSLMNDELNYLSDNLLIADALYGLIKPSDLISEYRLDYLSKFDFVKPSFYKEKISKVITEPFINLTSKEYSNILPEELAININFIQNLKGVEKSYSTNTKIARGKFVRYIARNKNTSIEVLKAFNEDGYTLDSINSDDRNIIFIKNV